MLSHIIDVLADPIDGSDLKLVDNRVVSATGHSYDVAKQGYVTLAGGAGLRYSGDDTSMIKARETFLSRGHFAPFVEAVSEALSYTSEAPVIAEIGAGTGYYLSHALDSIEDSRGVGLDVSVPAAKLLAKCHPRVGAVVADAWARLPIKDSSVDAIAVVFAPRNAAEFARVLKPEGEVVVLTADTGHLGELREPLGIIDVERGKVQRMIEQAAGHLVPVDTPQDVEFTMRLDQESIATQIGMSPSARHIHADILAERIAALPATMEVTAKAKITRFRKA
ncbi:methyltransferase domain-containing protein [Corynebacterium kozikiae]|uniref:methyltransferase domain-containing protein n=1 Tax=Corynebacterium kozikiae TaxID=2968469 RepID=UPI00211BC84B|nr:methyltransferase domain-containing protein [Corynebacterium sp. 76QC2CO]